MNDKTEVPEKNIIKGEMPLLSHLTELRRRLFVSLLFFLVCFVPAMILYDSVMAILMKPLLVLDSPVDNNVLYISTIFEGFLVRFKIGALLALILSSPVHLFNLIRFTFPALKKNEKTIVTATLVVSFVIILFSFFYSYYTILPVSILFLTGGGFIPSHTGIILNFSGNIAYILQFILVSLLVFQIPIVLEILLVLNLLKRKSLLSYGRYVVIFFFILSALLTPPDFVTQVGLALPLTLLYYLTILVAKIFRFGED